eukprot:1965326-Amphidinium_carterae.1
MLTTCLYLDGSQGRFWCYVRGNHKIGIQAALGRGRGSLVSGTPSLLSCIFLWNMESTICSTSNEWDGETTSESKNGIVIMTHHSLERFTDQSFSHLIFLRGFFPANSSQRREPTSHVQVDWLARAVCVRPSPCECLQIREATGLVDRVLLGSDMVLGLCLACLA